MGLFNRGEQSITISTETILKALGLAFLFILFVGFLGNIAHQLTLIGISLFLAIALNPAVTWITKKLPGKSRTLATGIAYLFVITILVGMITLVLPPIVRQTADFISDLPTTLQDVQDQDSAVGEVIRRYDLNEILDNWSVELRNRAGELTTPVYNTATRALSTIVSLVTVLVLTFMMLIEGPFWIRRLLDLQPEAKRDERRRVLKRMYRVVTGYVNGQVLIAAIAAVFTLVALLIGNMIFDASVNAVALAGISFVFALIPLFGNIIAAVIIFLATLFASVPFAVAMLAYYVIYQQIENATIQPYIQSRTNQLTPLIIFIAALVGIGLGGIVGALAAIPIAGCIKVLLDEYYLNGKPKQKQISKA